VVLEPHHVLHRAVVAFDLAVSHRVVRAPPSAPEPSRWLLLAAGLGCLTVLHRLRRRDWGKRCPLPRLRRRAAGSVEH
jgi:hypothetical protein